MPNTLAHVGAQGILIHIVRPGIDPKLVALGCLLPDIPWILQRVVTATGLYNDPYSTRLYCIAQASLLVTLCLCGALALLLQKPKEAFLILGGNSFLHLLLDGLQTKLANGVHFIAPISWDLWNVEWFWPESLPTYILTVCGLIYLIWHWKVGISRPLTFHPASFLCLALSAILFLLYFFLPFVFLEGPRKANNHYVMTLAEKDTREGKIIEFDRALYIKTSSGDVIQGFDGQKIKVSTPIFDHSVIISGRGTFSAPDTVTLHEIHQHLWGLRDVSTVVGIILMSAMWGLAFFQQRSNRT